MELYDSKTMPLSSDPKLRKIQEKVKNGEQLSIPEKMLLGRDTPIKSFDGYDFKSDHCYRCISEEALLDYQSKGFIIGFGDNDEYREYEENGQIFYDNKGVDWYLGGACPKYGKIIIECPADKKYFRPSFDNGNHLSNDPDVRHFKSSGSKNPVPFSMISKIIDTRKLQEQNTESFSKQSELEKKQYALIKQKNSLLLEQQLKKTNSLSKNYNNNGFANIVLLAIIVSFITLLVSIFIILNM